MNIKLTNQNYNATVVEIKTLIPLENCDNVQVTLIMGNQVVVGKNIKIGDIGLFFPVETALSEQYLSSNNLYRNKELNDDKTKVGYFEENRRIRCVKFRGINRKVYLCLLIHYISYMIKTENIQK